MIKKNGPGVYTDSKGDIYTGRWKNGEQGKLKLWKHPTIRNPRAIGALLSGARYIGEWKDGGPNGLGVAMFDDGSDYVGEFLNGAYHGQGTLTNVDRSTYCGKWINGKKNYDGVFTDPNGNEIEQV